MKKVGIVFLGFGFINESNLKRRKHREKEGKKKERREGGEGGGKCT